MPNMPRTPRLSEFPEELTPDQFFSLIGGAEHEQLDFKRQADGLGDVLPAMAMTDGGLVVLGIANDRSLRGCPLSQGTKDRVTQVAHAVGIDVQLREIVVGGKAITLVAIPEVQGRIVTTTDGRLLRRVGSSSQPLTGDALARFVRERERRSGEDESIPAIKADEFDLELVNRALRADGRAAVRRQNLVRALVDLQVAEPSMPPADHAVLRAAVLLFAKHPQQHVPGATVQVVRRVGVGPGPGPVRAREEFGGPLAVLVERVIGFVRGQTVQYEAVIGTHREHLAEYPEAVVREAILNAVAHRDYDLIGATIDVTVWDDRMEIQSPGPLPGHITSENMRDEHYSRNRRIMRVLKLLGFVEEYGEGVDRMFQEMEARLMEPPLFAATSSSVTVTLRNRSLVSLEDQVWLGLLGDLELDARERRLLVVARREGSLTRRRAREVLVGADGSGALDSAIAKGVLVQVGTRGGARYVLSDEIVVRAGSEGIQARTRKRQLLLDELQRRGSMSTAEAAAFLGETDTSAVRRILNDLTRAGHVRAKGRTRARRYYA